MKSHELAKWFLENPDRNVEVSVDIGTDEASQHDRVFAPVVEIVPAANTGHGPHVLICECGTFNFEYTRHAK